MKETLSKKENKSESQLEALVDSEQKSVDEIVEKLEDTYDFDEAAKILL